MCSHLGFYYLGLRKNNPHPKQREKKRRKIFEDHRTAPVEYSSRDASKRDERESIYRQVVAFFCESLLSARVLPLPRVRNDDEATAPRRLERRPYRRCRRRRPKKSSSRRSEEIDPTGGCQRCDDNKNDDSTPSSHSPNAFVFFFE
jgi:hypothetical protein